MRTGWTSPEAAAAHVYEEDFLDFQVYTENCFYDVAEHLVRYRAILHKAGEDIHELMNAMVEMCPKPAPPGEGDFNLMSMLVTGIVAATTTVISGGATAGVVMGIAVAEMVGDAAKTAKHEEGQQYELMLETTST